MLKMSELTPKTAALIQSLAAEYFDDIELAVITGGPEVGAEFAALPLDHLIFTGGTNIGKHILQAAANNLTPCTLELGGKSPVIVGRSYDIKKAAQRIFSGKALNTGQACLAPDYAFVHADDKETFIQAITDHVTELFPNVVKNDDYTAVINERHYQRIMSYINDARDKGGDVRQINPKNEDFTQQPEGIRKFPMTLVVDPSDDMLVMQEEIFGPVLSIKTYRNISECIQYINNRPRPLGLYYFGKDTAEERRVLDETISGGVTINDVMNHSSNDDLPFGGIGQSGMGNYHGYDGFRTFSHPRAIFKQTNLDLMKLAGMLPPYGDKSQRQLDKMTQVKWPRKL
jgi:coniferyl-aldehyde dehydrogenase